MASLTIRRLDDSLKRRLRIRAARHGHSMEEEAREVLRLGLTTEAAGEENLFDWIRRRIAKTGPVTLRIPRREPMREPPDFSK